MIECNFLFDNYFINLISLKDLSNFYLMKNSNNNSGIFLKKIMTQIFFPNS